MVELVLLGIALLLVVICGLFVMAEFALVTVNRSTVEAKVAAGDGSLSRVLEALRTLSTQLSSAQVGITITNLAIGFLAEPSIARLLHGPLTSAGVSETALSAIALTLGIVLATVVTMLFGELVPKNIAIARPLEASKWVAPFLLSFTWLIRGPISLINNSANAILARFGVEAQEELASARSADELLSLVKRSAEKGTLARETATLLERSLTFGDQTALDVMTPRVRVHAVASGTTISNALELARTTGVSRLPVYGDSLDDILGVLHIKHAFGVPRAKRSRTTVDTVMQPAVFVPSTIELEPLLASLRDGGLQMVIVVDEFGGTDGIITMEDVLEELVGDVHDEHDPEAPAFTRQKDGSYSLSGLLRPDEIAEQISIFLPDEDEVETLAGLFITQFGSIPKRRDKVMVRGVDEHGNDLDVELVVLRMDDRRIDRLGMTVRPAEEGEA